MQKVALEVAALQEHASHRKKRKYCIFANPLWFTCKNFETKEVKNIQCKKLQNYRKP